MNTLLFKLLLLLLLSKNMISYNRCSRLKKTSSLFLSTLLVNKELSVRPSIDDVEKISYGQAAKKRGTGSRAVPHRLNADERIEWDLAKKRGFVILRGSGFRKERQDSPLANSWRNYADANAMIAISIQKYSDEKGSCDILTLDFSPLRTQIGIDEFSKELLDITSKYNESIMSIEDTNIQTLGFANYEISLTDYAIWTIPVTGIILKFTDRKGAKILAQEIANKYCVMR